MDWVLLGPILPCLFGDWGHVQHGPPSLCMPQGRGGGTRSPEISVLGRQDMFIRNVVHLQELTYEEGETHFTWGQGD